MTAARPYIPRPGDAAAQPAQFPRSRGRSCACGGARRPRAARARAAADGGRRDCGRRSLAGERRRLSSGHKPLADLYFFWLHLRGSSRAARCCSAPRSFRATWSAAGPIVLSAA
jgi:hypothetical protein